MEKLDLIVVQTVSKGTKGSAILYLPPQQTEIVYAITAKHCVFGKNFDNDAQSIDIQLIWNDGKSYSLNAFARIHCFSANDPDIALLELPYAAIRACVGDLPMIRLSAWDKTIEKGSFKGFPNATDTKKAHKARTIKNLEILQEDSKDFLFYINTEQKLGSDDDSTIAAVKGFSGSGVWAEPILDNKCYLLGIVTDVEDWNNRFECVKIGVIQDLISMILPFSTPRQAEYLNLLHTANRDLRREKGYFGNYADSHIKRNETKLLSEWVEKPLQDKQRNISVLTGDGGYGKTNVLRDLLLELEDKMPVLAIKADKRAEKRLSDLAQQVFKGGNESIETVVNGLLQYHEKVVLIIDQLDALSQTLSTERAFLQTYDDLIQQFIDNQRVRIVMSVRKFDLEYDARLSVYKKETYSLDIQPLSVFQVQTFLSQIGIAQPSVKLIELLRVPNHLDIFCRLSEPHTANWDSLSSIGDLYKALWKTLHNDPALLGKDLKLEDLMFEMANKMNAKKRLYLEIAPFERKYRKELAYLQSKTIILENDKKIQFFHQTFYEYAYARDFVESGKVLSQEILDSEQNLYIRSRIKLILEYLRDYDEETFVETVTELIHDKQYRFHIKLLVINILGNIKKPNELEKAFVQQVILTHEKYARLFMDSVFSGGWLVFLKEKEVINQYLTMNDTVELEKNANLILRLLKNNVNFRTDLVLGCFDEMPNINLKPNMISNILWHLDIWKNIRLLNYFKKYVYKSDNNKHFIVRSLEKIIVFHPKYAFEVIESIIRDKCPVGSIYESFVKNLENYEKRFLTKICDDYPDKMSDIFLNIIMDVAKIDTTPYFKQSTLRGSNYFPYVVDKEDNMDTFIFNQLSKSIENKAITDKNNFITLFEKYKDSDVIPVLKLLLLGLTAAKTYPIQFMKLVHIIHLKKGFTGKQYFYSPQHHFSFVLQGAIKTYFPIVEPNHQLEIIDIILNIRDIENAYIRTVEGKKKIYLGGCGRKTYQYITLLPTMTIEKHPLLKKRYEELKRKKFELYDSAIYLKTKGDAGSVQPPLGKDIYGKMGFRGWKKSMLKFNPNYERKWWIHGELLKGDIEQHASTFEKYIEQDIQKFAPFVTQLIEKREVALEYMESGLEGLCKGGYNPLEIQRMYKLMIQYDSKTIIYIVNNYLIENYLVDLEIVKHLATITLNDANTFYIGQLMQCNYDISFKEILFETIERIVDKQQYNFCNRLIPNLPYLNDWDKDRAFQIFMKLAMNSQETNGLSYSTVAAAKYCSKYFVAMRPYFDKIIQMGTPASHLIYWCWRKQYKGADELLEAYLNRNDESIVEILGQAERNLWIEGRLNPQSMGLFERFLNSESSELASAYSGMILRCFSKMKSSNQEYAIEKFTIIEDFF